MTNLISLTGLQVKLSRPGAELPTRNHESAGYDLYIPAQVNLRAGELQNVQLGIKVDIPYGYFGRILDRSGLALDGVSTVGGVIDNDYRGEWSVIIKSDRNMILPGGSRIAQVVFLPYGVFEVSEVESLGDTRRSCDGFGSSGL